MERGESVPVGQAEVGAVLDEGACGLEIAGAARAVQRRLAEVRVVGVDVHVLAVEPEEGLDVEAARPRQLGLEVRVHDPRTGGHDGAHRQRRRRLQRLQQLVVARGELGFPVDQDFLRLVLLLLALFRDLVQVLQHNDGQQGEQVAPDLGRTDKLWPGQREGSGVQSPIMHY